MIGSLRGTLLDRSTAGEVLIEVGGVGYRATMGPAAALTLGDVGSEVFVWVHHHIREDAQALYAFSGRDERTCFEALLGAHGVGPSLALAILSVHRPDALRGVLASDDVDALCLVPGVGKKTAARLLVELKSRLDAGEIDPAAIAAAAGGSTSSERPGARRRPRCARRPRLRSRRGGCGAARGARRARRRCRRRAQAGAAAPGRRPMTEVR